MNTKRNINVLLPAGSFYVLDSPGTLGGLICQCLFLRVKISSTVQLVVPVDETIPRVVFRTRRPGRKRFGRSRGRPAGYCVFYRTIGITNAPGRSGNKNAGAYF